MTIGSTSEAASAVVVTGAGGYVGSAVAAALIRSADAGALFFSNGPPVENVIGVLRPGGSKERLYPLTESLRFSLVECDIADVSSAGKILQGIRPRAIIHTAMDASLHFEQPEDEQRRLIDAPLEMFCRVLADVPGARLITTGTCAVCAPSASMNEDAPYDPHPGYLHYARHKIREEAVLRRLTATFALSWVHLRLFYLFGGYEAERRLLPLVVRGLLQGRPVYLGDKALVRDYAHVDDVAEAFLRSLECGGGVYNIGSGKGFSIAQLAAAIAETGGDPGLLRFDEVETRDAARPEPVIANPAKAAAELGWRADGDVVGRLKEAALEWRRKLLAEDADLAEPEPKAVFIRKPLKG